jgi:hypothetical protein
MKTTKYFTTNTKDNATFALALGVAAIALVTLFANNVNANTNTNVATPVQTLDTIVVTAPRIHTVHLDTIVVTASRNMNADNIIVAAK